MRSPWPKGFFWSKPAEIGDCGYCGRPRQPGLYICADHASKLKRTARSLRKAGSRGESISPARFKTRQKRGLLSPR